MQLFLAYSAFGPSDRANHSSLKVLTEMVIPEGLEPPTYRLGICRSILMSYGTTVAVYNYSSAATRLIVGLETRFTQIIMLPLTGNRPSTTLIDFRKRVKHNHRL